MILPDVNLLVYAHREELPQHRKSREWLEETLASSEPFGMANVVLSGFLRIVTHHKIFDPPSPMEKALAFVAAIHERPNCVPVQPGPSHWSLFAELCRRPGIKGGLVSDAYLAALAIEHGCEFVTMDGDFARFAPPLRIRSPF